MIDTSVHLYVLALGSNRALSARRTPVALLAEAAAMIGQGGTVRALSPTIITPPIGPSRRRFANAALLVESALSPPDMLTWVQDIEQRLGRRRHRRWGARSVDIDIILWSGGLWSNRSLTIPHPAFCQRAFVLTPMLAIVPGWREPRWGLCVRHMWARLQKGRPVRAARG